MALIPNAFPHLKSEKTWLDTSLKSPVLEHSLIVNMLKAPEHRWNLHGNTFIKVLIILMEVKSENVSFSDIWNLRTVC